MKYCDVFEGKFIKRVNRFIAEVEIDGVLEKVHVKNTGRCKELFIEGVTVYLEKSNNPNRKTKYSLIGIIKAGTLINIDSQVPNKVVYDAIEAGMIHEINDVVFMKREVTYKKSRFDLYFETAQGKKGFVEIKGVTLENDGEAMFPDAPTDRGRKHVLEMIEAVSEGYLGYIFFLVQMKGVNRFKTNSITDPKFTEAIDLARKSGVHVLVYDATIGHDSILIGNRIDF